MTPREKEKQIQQRWSDDKLQLVKELCARITYGVNVYWNGEHNIVKLYKVKLYGTTPDDYVFSGLGQPEPDYEYDMRLNDIKPYLRSLSTMTKEEAKWCDPFYNYEGVDENVISEYIDWMYSHHFDINKLIERGLAVEAPEDMYN